MRVLVTGAYGFIGQHIAVGLARAGHEVVACGRDLALGRRLLPGFEWQFCDFNKDTDEAVWLPRLAGVHAVVNCVGILQPTVRDTHQKAHVAGPVALFSAARKAGVRRIVQISALGAEGGAGTDYSASKSVGDDFLKSLDIDWVVMKPSLVYGRGSFGGTTLLRSLAGLPGVVPLVDGGRHAFQPVFMDDLVASVVRLVEPDAPSRIEIAITGPAPKTTREIALLIRRWLGFPEARVLNIPAWLAKPMLLLGDVAGWFGLPTAFRSSSLRQMELGNTANCDAAVAATGIVPRPMDVALADSPSTLQDRLHARSAMAVALLRVTIGLFWLATGVISLLPSVNLVAASFVGATGLGEQGSRLLVTSAGIADVALGLPFLAGWQVRLFGSLQIALTLAYLVVLSIWLPAMWLDPFGPLMKAVPLIFATLVVMAWAERR
ncbi:MAG: NAD-dependent epimerase/dehydratase family protein [Parvibaculaceae bacterium]|nr:NAD-dependent epimerase/dehydratase family protein [Parvibaculaceae bacterium]